MIPILNNNYTKMTCDNYTKESLNREVHVYVDLPDFWKTIPLYFVEFIYLMLWKTTCFDEKENIYGDVMSIEPNYLFYNYELNIQKVLKQNNYRNKIVYNSNTI